MNITQTSVYLVRKEIITFSNLTNDGSRQQKCCTRQQKGGYLVSTRSSLMQSHARSPFRNS
ncbi:uncharacterized protein PHALS_15235 [Plasmopara halstedii]|uniref:Uncharacterized protein n=1 Tax=Plasmopara halstedii TaxID=4781 RepID=A0A0P1B7B3_PLAHL|nr:uncharacterized protein PHALS_15235 [Plasmopara halstedii]CEG49748.1 hypothetical protein PHALS_15235 [Plasmopara halstedii]|eukprot:XP_024586117.1 hypothetical protein PHALS_15235 [Plasmopara halstedii]